VTVRVVVIALVIRALVFLTAAALIVSAASVIL
jgi:hypothetical protein